MSKELESRSAQWNPVRELNRMRSEFDRLMNDMLETSPERTESLGFMPSCDFMEDENAFTIKFDMPGIKKENVKMELNRNTLTVSAERSEEAERKNKKSHYSEVSYGSYYRSFSLPSSVDEKKIDAKLENGVLTVVLPKSEKSSVKQIAIH